MTTESGNEDATAALWGGGGVISRRVIPQFGWLLIALFVGGAVLLPILQLEWRAFSDGASAFSRMAKLPRIWTTVQTTAILAMASSVLAMLIGIALAWCASMLPRPARKIGQIIPLLPVVVPAVAAVTGWVFLLSPTVGYINTALRMLPGLNDLNTGPFNIYTTSGIVIITALLLSSFVYLFVHTGLENMGQELEAAAAASGASPVRRFFTITIPLLRPSILSASAIVFLLGMGQFTAPLLLGKSAHVDVLTTEMFYLLDEYPVDYGLGAALGFPILAVGLVLVAVQKIALGEQRRFVVVSAKARHQRRDTSWWAAAVILVYGLATTLLPLLALTYVSLSPYWMGSLDFQSLTLKHYTVALGNPLIAGAIWTSVKASVGAVVIVIVIGFLCATALLQSSRVPPPLRAAIDFFVILPMAVPASLLGFGLLFAYTGPPLPLYGTTAVLVVTYLTLMINHSTRLQFSSLVAIGPEFQDASKACGAGPLRTFLLVTLPLVRKGIGATAALTFVLLFHEFSASMMVRSIQTQVVGSVMYDIWVGGIYPQVAVLALIMVAVTVIGVLAAIWLGGVNSLKAE